MTINEVKKTIEKFKHIGRPLDSIVINSKDFSLLVEEYFDDQPPCRSMVFGGIKIVSSNYVPLGYMVKVFQDTGMSFPPNFGRKPTESMGRFFSIVDKQSKQHDCKHSFEPENNDGSLTYVCTKCDLRISDKEHLTYCLTGYFSNEEEKKTNLGEE